MVGIIMDTWPGPGKGWDPPTMARDGKRIRGNNEQQPGHQPFRDKSMAHEIMGLKGKNSGGFDMSTITDTADQKSRKENFKF